jgi:hypothetical protein
MSGTNLIWLEGRLVEWRELDVRLGDYQGYTVVGTLVSDSAAYGGRHAVIFPEALGRALLPHVVSGCDEACALSLGGTLQSHGAQQSVHVREFTSYAGSAGS